MRGLATVGVLIMLVPGAGAVGANQAADPTGTGFVEDGPAWLDVSLQFQVSGNFAYNDLVVDGDMVLWKGNGPCDGSSTIAATLGTSARILYRIDVTAGNSSILACIPGFVYSPIGYGDGAVVVVAADLVYAINVDDGSVRWAVPWILPDTPAVPREAYLNGPSCAVPRISDGGVLLACYEAGLPSVRRLSMEDGSTRWELSADELFDASMEMPGLTATGPVKQATTAVSSGRAFVLIHGAPLGYSSPLLAFDWETGELAWMDEVGIQAQANEVGVSRTVASGGVHMAATASTVFITIDQDLLALDAGTGAAIWHHPYLEQFYQGSNGGALSVSGDAVYTATNLIPKRVSHAGTLVWPRDASTTNSIPGAAHALMATDGDRLWISNHVGVTTLETRNGQPVDAAVAPGPPFSAHSFAVGEGLAARVIDNGNGTSTLTIYGHTRFSPSFELALADPYPEVQSAATLRVASWNAFDAERLVEFLIDWGDHTTTTTQEPTFSHEYDEAGQYLIRVRGTTDAGRQYTTTATVNVGGEPPTFLSEAFSAENQESTFFLLGIIVILLGSAFGAVRLRRKRGILRKELAKADDIVAGHRDDPDAMRIQLRDHRSRARRLFLDGRLDEGSTGILERHIDELLRDHRLSTVEAELGFLPHELFRSMQEMLRDARVTQLEKNQFLVALAAAKGLTSSQRTQVKRHVETWHREDRA